MRAITGILGAILATSNAMAEPGTSDAQPVTSFGVADLDALGIRSTGALLGHVPNLAGATVPGVGSATAFYLRGMGASETVASIDSPVSLFIDGVQFSRVNGNDIGFFDVERVDVLRGTQNALYGRNTSGGAINVQLKRPGDTVGGFVEAGYGSFDKILVRGSIDLPLGDALAVKISAYAEDDDGYAKNNWTDERLNSDDRAGMRIAALLKPTERLSWHIALSYTEANGENLLAFDCDPTDPGKCGGRYSSTGMTRAARLGGFTQYDLPVTGRKAGFTLGNALSTTMITSNVEWGGDKLKLQLLTGLADVTEEQALDYADGREIPSNAFPDPIVRGYRNGGYAVLNDGSHRQFSQDIRLSGEMGWLKWVAGAQVQDEQTTNDMAEMQTYDDGTPDGVPVLYADRVIRNKTSAWAGYLQLDARPMDALTISAGVRHTDEDKKLSVRDNRGNCALLAPGCLTGDLDQQSKVWAPNLSVSFAPTDSLLLYARAAKGYRSGGWNARAKSLFTMTPLDAETAWTYEAGVKSIWFDGKLRAAVTGFLVDASGLAFTEAQNMPWFGDPNNPGRAMADWFLMDPGGFSSKGVELDIAANPLDGLGLYLNLGWKHSDYDGLMGDSQTPYAPDLTLALGGSYDFAIPSAGIIAMPSVDLVYRSEMLTSYVYSPADATADAHWQLNLSLALRTDDDNWSLALTCENCLDRTETEATLLGNNYLNKPVTWLLRARRRF